MSAKWGHATWVHAAPFLRGRHITSPSAGMHAEVAVMGASLNAPQNERRFSIYLYLGILGMVFDSILPKTQTFTAEMDWVARTSQT